MDQKEVLSKIRKLKAEIEDTQSLIDTLYEEAGIDAKVNSALSRVNSILHSEWLSAQERQKSSGDDAEFYYSKGEENGINIAQRIIQEIIGQG